ncbi:MAG: DUF58 domain-containing protein [bacterium]
MLPKEVIRKIRRIEITTKKAVNDLFAGEYHSTFKGQGMEFEEVREYQPGDDIRLIDWNVTARSGTPFVKKFKEERELTVMLLVDASSSGQFGTRSQLKSEMAAEICGLLAFSAIRNNDKVGMIIFTDEVEKFIAPRKGSAHVLRLIREILYFKPVGRSTNIAGALEYFSRVVKRRSVVFLISDFLGAGYAKDLQVANRKHDVIALQMTDEREAKLANFGIIEFEDAETGEVIAIDTSDSVFRRQFTQRAEEIETSLSQAFSRLAVDFVKLTTGQDYIHPLASFFKMRERRLRR